MPPRLRFFVVFRRHC